MGPGAADGSFASAAVRFGSEAPATMPKAAMEDASAIARNGRRQPNLDIKPSKVTHNVEREERILQKVEGRKSTPLYKKTCKELADCDTPTSRNAYIAGHGRAVSWAEQITHHRVH